MASDSGVRVAIRKAPPVEPAGARARLQIEGVVRQGDLVETRLDDRHRDLLIDGDREVEPVVQGATVFLDEPDLAPMDPRPVQGEPEGVLDGALGSEVECRADRIPVTPSMCSSTCFCCGTVAVFETSTAA